MRNNIILTLLVFTSMIYAQVTSDTQYQGARQLALAGSDIAWEQDAFAVFHNPAGAAWQNNLRVGLGYEHLFGLSYLPHITTAVSVPVGKYGTSSLSFEQLAVSYQSNDLSTENSLGVSQSFFLMKDRMTSLAVGISFNYYSVNYGKSAGISGDGSDGINLGSTSTYGLSLGFQGSLHETHWVGAWVKNINSPGLDNADVVSYLPRSIALGYSYAPYHLVRTHFSMTKSVGRIGQYHAGLEYELTPYFTVLSGVHSNPNRFGAGLKLHVKSMNIYYAILTHPVLPLAQQFTFGMAF